MKPEGVGGWHDGVSIRQTTWLGVKAGQFLDMTLLTPAETDAEGNTRSFSIASGPDEDMLMVATRMRDTAFKRVLKTMPLGTAVSAGAAPLYFIAGPPQMVQGLPATYTRKNSQVTERGHVP